MRLGILIALIIEFHAWATALAAHFEVAGTFAATRLDVGNHKKAVIRSVNHYKFDVRVNGSRWWMRIVDVEAKNGSYDDAPVRVRSYDGRDQYEVLHWRKDQLLRKDQPTRSAIVVPSDMPRKGTTVERMLWLAFCSAKAIDSHPKLLSINDPAGRSVKGDITRLQVGGLPLTLIQVTTGIVSLGTNIPSVDDPEVIKTLSITFTYRVLSATNVNGALIPMRFKGKFHLRDRQPHRTVLAGDTMRFVGTVNDISPALKGPAGITLGGKAYVYDYRFKGPNRVAPLMYFETNRQWISRTDPHLQNTIARQILIRPQPQQPHMVNTISRWIVLFALGVIFVVPLLYWLFRRKA